MKLFDVNILIYAHRTTQKHHEFYRDYVERTINGGEPFALSPLVAAGFVRIITNPGFPDGPTPIAQALAVIDSLVNHPNCHWVFAGTRHWEICSNLCRRIPCTGKQVADAQHAAIAIENACTWVTRDRDFVALTQHGLKLTLLEPVSDLP